MGSLTESMHGILVWAFKAFVVVIPMVIGIWLSLRIGKLVYGREHQLMPVMVLAGTTEAQSLSMPLSQRLQVKMNEARELVMWESESGFGEILETDITGHSLPPIDVNLVAYGVDVGGVMSWIRRQGSFGSRISAVVYIEDNGARCTVLGRYQGDQLQGNGSTKFVDEMWDVESPGGDPNKAIDRAAASMVLKHAAALHPRFVGVSEAEFTRYVEACRYLRSASRRDASNEVLADRNQALRLLESITKGDQGNLADAYIRLASLHEAEAKYESAIRLYETARKKWQGARVDKRVRSIQAKLDARRSEELASLRARHRPLRTGVSIGSEGFPPVTLAAVYWDEETNRWYGITTVLGPLLLGETQTYVPPPPIVMQPAPSAGGIDSDDIIGEYRPFDKSYQYHELMRAESLAASLLVGRIEFSPAIQTALSTDLKGWRHVGVIGSNPHFSEVRPDAKVVVYGHGTGRTEGKIETIESTAPVFFEIEGEGIGRTMTLVRDAIFVSNSLVPEDQGALVCLTDGGPAVGVVIGVTSSGAIVAPLPRELQYEQLYTNPVMRE